MITNDNLVWKPSTEEFQKICSDSSCLADILRTLGYTTLSGNYKTLHKRIIKEKIDVSHISYGKGSKPLRRGGGRPKPPEEVFVEDSNYSTKNLKRQILKMKLLEYKCAVCNNTGIWNNMPLVLRLDHINGDNMNNKLENLRFICPNCDSQSPTFAGRNIRNKKSTGV